MAKESAGLLLFRRGSRGTEVLLVHPGGPFWARKDEGSWSIPKGLIGENEDPLAAAEREFEEETGRKAPPLRPPEGEAIALGAQKQPGGKIVHAWAVHGDFDPDRLNSNRFTLEWPWGSGRLQEFPEVDRAEWFALADARTKILKGQSVFLDRLQAHIDAGAQPRP